MRGNVNMCGNVNTCDNVNMCGNANTCGNVNTSGNVNTFMLTGRIPARTQGYVHTIVFSGEDMIYIYISYPDQFFISVNISFILIFKP